MRLFLITLLLFLATGCDSQGPAADSPSGPEIPSPEPDIEDGEPSWQFTDCSTVRETNHTLLFAGGALEAFIEGDTVYAFTQDSLCVGKSGAFEGKNFAISVWGDDSQTQNKDGLTSGEGYTLVLVSTRYSSPVTLSPVDVEGPLQYTPDGITTIRGLRLE